MTKSVRNMVLEQMDTRFGRDEWFVSFLTAIKDIDAAEASWRPNNEGNSIWQIVNHLTFWNRDAIQRLEGTKDYTTQSIDNDDTFGSPGDPSDETGWTNAREQVIAVLEELRALTARLSDEQLDGTYGPNKAPVSGLLGNLVMHDAYHMGQIVLLRKIRGSWQKFDW